MHLKLCVKVEWKQQFTSWRTRVTTAKYIGKSLVRMRVIRVECKSSNCWSSLASNDSFKTSWTASSVASNWCSFQCWPSSERKITISRSRPRNEAKWGTYNLIVNILIINNLPPRRQGPKTWLREVPFPKCEMQALHPRWAAADEQVSPEIFVHEHTKI